MDSDKASNTPLARARSLLFVPGNRPERFGKALASGADAVVLDLEDAVPASDKAAARVAVGAALAAGLGSAAVPIVIRLNAVESEAGCEDLRWLRGMPQPGSAGLMLAKAESAVQVEQVHREHPGRPLLPLIESARGFIELGAMAAAPGVLRLVVGHIDFMADTGLRCSDDQHELDTLRFHVAMQTRVHGLAPAVDGVTVLLDDEHRIERDARRALHFGFGGKLCIHPRQVVPIHRAFAPSDAELDWARRVTAADRAAGGAAVQLDGRMVDLPVVLQARALLARAGFSESLP
jgi:citrate lyase subunit beta / citryl-CoA lyase